MKPAALATSRKIIAVHSKSFALSSRLLPPLARDRAVVVYAWCRRADDAVDLMTTGDSHAALHSLRSELDAIYAGSPLQDPILEAFQQVVGERGIPRLYPDELIAGLAMDADGRRYDTLPQLLHYCYRVAGTVGLMMCHVLGVRDEVATRHAVHLGVAMQLTNICRDVGEDWQRRRLYLPVEMLRQHDCAWIADLGGQPFPARARTAVAPVIAALLAIADDYYRSGDAGLPLLDWRSSVAIRTARQVYSHIGARVRAQACDPLAGRAFVPTAAKLVLAGRAAAASVRLAFESRRGLGSPVVPRRVVHADDVLPLTGEASVSSAIYSHRSSS